MTQKKTMLTVVTTTTPKTGTRGPEEQVRKLVEQGIPLETLRENFTQFLESLHQIVSIKEGRVGDFSLDEVTFNVEISVEGEFKLLGSGVGMTAGSGISFTMRRQKTAKEI
jgi:hypothetical protein